MVDKKFDDSESDLIKMIAKANGVTSEDMDGMIKEMLQSARDKPIYIPTLSDDEKFEYLYNIVQLMKIDSEVYLSEINFCEEIAVKLGFNKNVIGRLSRQIFSDPSITVNRDKLREAVMKFKN
ncbi:MAG: TerB family tellurite resistance protein [Bacteroidetes bacterium]|nr:TerB family tellurite resistance protein [Bacteroidota bacterium]MDA1119065.1 TerB family tellurite resistance protein [Bacteroidota bacterium]